MKKTYKLYIITAIIIMLVMSFDKVFAFNTDYPEKDKREDGNKNKAIGVAVIPKEDVKDVNAYYFLYYDEEGEVHIVEYIQNPMHSEWNNSQENQSNRKWILKNEADITKAKELGAKEYYSDENQIKSDENSGATALFKKITEETGQRRSLYDYIEGSTQDEEPYTIESIIYNKVPIFDVNFFSDKAAGKEVKSDSTVGIIRHLMAIWYVSFRNVAFVSLAILIIYYGIRMAISTVASDRAHYKQMVFSWVKSLMIVLLIHYVMYIVIYFNETFIGIITESKANEASIYNTIKTRALEAPLKVAVPATLLYFILLFMWIRFIFVYFKRTFAVAFLVILAPLVGIRYSIESAKGKGSQMVASWIQRFITTVFMQSIHALIYSVFVETALETALDDLYGFFVAVFLLNFIISADKIFVNLFKFEFNPSTLGEIRKPFNPAEQFVEWKAGLEIGKGALSVVQEVGTSAKNTAGAALNRGYIKATDKLDDKYGGNHRRQIEDGINEVLDRIDDRFIKDEVDENGRPIDLSRREVDRNRKFKLRKLSRRRGKEGARAKKYLRLNSKLKDTRFRSEFKIFRDLGAGTIGLIFAIPLAVTSEDPSKGILTGIQAPGRFRSAGREVNRLNRKIARREREFDKAVKNANLSDKKMDQLEKKINKLSDSKKEKALDELKSFNSIDANAYSIQAAILKYVQSNDITKIGDDDLESIIDDVVDNMQGDLNEDERESIKRRAKEIIAANMKSKQRNKFEEKIEDREREEDEKRRARREHQYSRHEETNDDEPDEEQNSDELEETPNPEMRFEDDEIQERPKTGSGQGRETKNKDRENENSTNEENRMFTEGLYGIGTVNFSDIARGIESAVIEEKISDKETADLARIVNQIKDIDAKQTKNLGNRRVADTNRFLDSF